MKRTSVTVLEARQKAFAEEKLRELMQPKDYLKESKVTLKIGRSKFFFKNEESYEVFKNNTEPKLKLSGKRIVVRY